MRALQTELAEARLGLSASQVRDEHNSDDLQTQCQQLMGKLAVAETEGERARAYSSAHKHARTLCERTPVGLVVWGWWCPPRYRCARTHARTHAHTGARKDGQIQQLEHRLEHARSQVQTAEQQVRETLVCIQSQVHYS